MTLGVIKGDLNSMVIEMTFSLEVESSISYPHGCTKKILTMYKN